MSTSESGMRYTRTDLTAAEVLTVGSGRYKSPPARNKWMTPSFVVTGAVSVLLVCLGQSAAKHVADLLLGLAIIPFGAMAGIAVFGWALPARRYGKVFLAQTQKTDKGDVDV